MKQLLAALTFSLLVFSCNKKEDDSTKEPPVSFADCSTVLDGWDISVSQIPFVAGLRDVFFVNENEGFAVGGNGAIVKTTDGGQDWILLEQGVDFTTNQLIANAVTVADLHTVYFVDEQVGYAAGSNEYISGINEVNTEAVLLKTTDGGETWNKQYLPGILLVRDIHFFDVENGIGVFLEKFGDSSSNTKLYKTQDGGATWEVFPLPENMTVQAYNGWVDEFEGGIGVLAGHDQFDIEYLQTTDQAATWSEVPIPDSIVCRRIDFRTPTEGYANCLSFVFQTTDKGVSWEQLFNEYIYEATYVYNLTPSEIFSVLWVSDLEIINGDSTYALSSFEIYQSVDSTKTWKKSVVDKECYLAGKEFFYSKDLFFIVGPFSVAKFKKK